MKWLFIINPIENLNPLHDSSYLIMNEASSGGIDIHYCSEKDVYFKKEVRSQTTKLTFKNRIHTKQKSSDTSLQSFDAIFIRKDPPFHLDYLYLTQLLELTKAKVINNPQSLRDYNEKLIALPFKEFMPRTLISANTKQILAFIKKNNNKCVLKALDSHQGKIVKIVTTKSRKTIEEYTKKETLQVQIQEFLPKVSKGNKRVFMLGGKVLGYYTSIPKKGTYLSSLYLGSKEAQSSLTKQEEKILKKIGPFLKKAEIHLAGIDFIDNKLTEINITCPSGLPTINRVNNVRCEKKVVDYFLKLIERNK